MKTIGDAWWVFCCVQYAARWIRGGERAEYELLTLLIVGLIPSIILWWKAGTFKRVDK